MVKVGDMRRYIDEEPSETAKAFTQLYGGDWGRYAADLRWAKFIDMWAAISLGELLTYNLMNVAHAPTLEERVLHAREVSSVIVTLLVAEKKRRT